MPSPGPGSTGGKKVTENGVKRKKKSASEVRRAVDWREGKGGRFGRQAAKASPGVAKAALRRPHSFPSPDYRWACFARGIFFFFVFQLSSFSLNAELTYAKLFAKSPSIKQLSKATTLDEFMTRPFMRNHCRKQPAPTGSLSNYDGDGYENIT